MTTPLNPYIPSVKHAGGRPAMYKTVEELQEAIDKYFQSCFIPYIDKHGNQVFNKDGEQVYIQNQPFTIIGLALALGFKDRQSLIDYNEKPEFTWTITRAKQICEQYANNRLFDKDGCNGAKFTLINNFKGYKQDGIFGNDEDLDSVSITFNRTKKADTESKEG